MIYQNKNITPYNFRYHAEIMYETLDGFNFCNANGNTVDELLWDIDDRFNYYKHREPKIISVYKNPNEDKTDITKDILGIFFSKRSK